LIVVLAVVFFIIFILVLFFLNLIHLFLLIVEVKIILAFFIRIIIFLLFFILLVAILFLLAIWLITTFNFTPFCNSNLRFFGGGLSFSPRAVFLLPKRYLDLFLLHTFFGGLCIIRAH
jgi:hypothetical protein